MCVKREKNSYANTGTICKYLGNNVSRNILQYYAIIDCDATLFFDIIGRINEPNPNPNPTLTLHYPNIQKSP